MYAKVDIARIYSTITTNMCTNIQFYADYTDDILGLMNTNMLKNLFCTCVDIVVVYCYFVRECKLYNRSYRKEKLVES